MAKLYYGNGKCTIEGNAYGVEINYKGAIEIDDKTSEGFAIVANSQRIIVFPLSGGVLGDLFDYVGSFKILSAIVSDEHGNRVPCSIHGVTDYSEFLESKAEDMTVISEDLSSGSVYGGRVAKTVLKQPIIANQHTSNQMADLFLENRDVYTGYFHVHLYDGAAMTGREHTEDYEDLYIKQYFNERIPRFTKKTKW